MPKRSPGASEALEKAAALAASIAERNAQKETGDGGEPETAIDKKLATAKDRSRWDTGSVWL